MLSLVYRTKTVCVWGNSTSWLRLQSKKTSKFQHKKQVKAVKGEIYPDKRWTNAPVSLMCNREINIWAEMWSFVYLQSSLIYSYLRSLQVRLITDKMSSWLWILTDRREEVRVRTLIWFNLLNLGPTNRSKWVFSFHKVSVKSGTYSFYLKSIFCLFFFFTFLAVSFFLSLLVSFYAGSFPPERIPDAAYVSFYCLEADEWPPSALWANRNKRLEHGWIRDQTRKGLV